MKKAPKTPDGWNTVRQQLATWEKPALLALVKDLYEAAAGNRDFIPTRIQAGEGGGEALERYRGKIVEQFFPARGFGKLKLGEARKAIHVGHTKIEGEPQRLPFGWLRSERGTGELNWSPYR